MANINPILIAIKDSEEREAFEKHISARGHNYVSVSDGTKAMEEALKTTPSLIIADLDLPVIEGERLFQILANNPNTARVPFIFLSDYVTDVKGFRVNMDTFIIKPFTWEEVHAYVKKSILLSSEGINSIEGKDIVGRLSHISLVDILQVLHFNQKEGELIISDANQTAIIFMKEGQVYDALLGEATGEKALFRIFTWKDGSFEFHPRTISTDQKIQDVTGSLLMEGMRQLDELEKGKSTFPDRNSIIKLNVDSTTLPDGLKPIIKEIVFLIEFYPKVENLVNHCTYTDYDVYTTLMSLIEKKVIEVIKVGEGEEGGELISSAEALRVKEKIASTWDDMLAAKYGKVFIVSTRPELSRDFIVSCKCIPEFVLNKKLLPNMSEEDSQTIVNLGQMGSLKLYGDLEVVFFSVPTADGMGPLIHALSSNLIGLILIWDDKEDQWGSSLDGLGLTKLSILSERVVSVLHVFTGKAAPNKDIMVKYTSSLKLSQNEKILVFDPEKETEVSIIIKDFFDDLIKEDIA